MLQDIPRARRVRRPLSTSSLGLEALEARELLADTAVIAGIMGPASVQRGQTASFTLLAVTGRSSGAQLNYSFWIDWDSNGSYDQVVFGPAGKTVNHVFAQSGATKVSVLALGSFGRWSNVGSHNINVIGTGVVTDPARPGVRSLIWDGSAGKDEVSIVRLGTSVMIVESRFNGATVNRTTTYDNINGTITIAGMNGDDRIDGSAAGDLALIIDGGAGNDTILGGPGADMLDGGAGNDLLLGGDGKDLLNGGEGADILAGQRGDDLLNGAAGRDLLFGGEGADLLTAGGSEDLLLAGTSTWTDAGQADLEALDLLRREWNSGRTYSQRVANLLGTGRGTRANEDVLIKPGQTVFSDAAVDKLIGGAQGDWFLLTTAADATSALPADRPADIESLETVTGTTRIAPIEAAQPLVIIRAWPTEAEAIMDRIQAQGLQGRLPFDGFHIVARHTDPYDPFHKQGVKAAAAAVKRAFDLGLTKSGAGLVLFPQAGEWTSVSAWTRWRNELRALRRELDALGVRNDYVFGIDVEDYPIGDAARPPSGPLNASLLEATAMARAAIASGFRAELSNSFGHTIRMVYPTGRAPLFQQEIAAAIIMRANGLGDEYSFVLTASILEGTEYNERIWTEIFQQQEILADSLGFMQIVGSKASMLRPDNADKWAEFLRVAQSPEIVFMHLDDREMFGENW